jgi:hypothetical protein
MAAIDRMKNQHSGKDDMGELGQQEAHSSQPDACRITLDPSTFNPSVFSSTRQDRASVFSTGLGSAFKNTQAGNANNARHQTPPRRATSRRVGQQCEAKNPPRRAASRWVGKQCGASDPPRRVTSRWVGSFKRD